MGNSENYQPRYFIKVFKLLFLVFAFFFRFCVLSMGHFIAFFVFSSHNKINYKLNRISDCVCISMFLHT